MSWVKLIFTLFCCCWTALVSAQYQSRQRAPIQKRATVHLSAQSDDYFSVLQRKAAPSPSGNSYRDFLERQKLKQSKRFPRRDIEGTTSRSEADPPFVIRDFEGNNANTGIPLDNHLAISNDGMVLSVINNNIAVYDKTGSRLSSRSLTKFSEGLTTLSTSKFDPRVIYDPVEDRFIIVFISGFECVNSEIILAFSDTPDPSGLWHLYLLDGCPFDNQTFADYPMISLTEQELFLTINAVKENVSWQEGFVASLIWQLDKVAGFSGGELNNRLWSDIQPGDPHIRNLCPIKTANQPGGAKAYFLSNRNFDLRNDSIFLLTIEGRQDDPDLSLEMEVILTDAPYGLAPNAQQKFGFLQTNDSRVLDGFVLEDQIQFVMNCIDTLRGKAAVYHGVLTGLDGEKTITGRVLTNDRDEFSYPGIAYTGQTESERDAVIVMAHSSRVRNVGWSALYYDGEGQYSEIITVKEGQNFIDLLDENLERWGDYIGIQRRYDSPGRVWAASTYGNSGKRYATWIAEIGRPGLDLTDVDNLPEAPSLKLFPNPTQADVQLSFTFPGQEKLEVYITDVSGQVVKRFFRERVKGSGTFEFSFSTAPLEGGVYFLQLRTGRQLLGSKRFVVLK